VRSQRVPPGNLPSAPSVDAGLAALAARQHGVAGLQQLVALGLSRSAISKRVARGVLHRRYRGVYTVGHDALSREAEWLAAVFAVGGPALSHRSATELHGLTRSRAHLIDVIVPHHRRPPAGISVHRVRRLDPRDVTTERGIPVTAVHRLLVDLCDVRTPHEIAAVIKEAAFRGRFVEAAVRDSMARANGRHNLHVLDRAIEVYRAGSAGTRSSNEVLFLQLDLPDSLVNTQLLGYEADFLWPQSRLNVEIDGLQHNTPAARRDDAIRDRTLTAAGYTVLRFPEEMLRERPEDVLGAVANALAWPARPGPGRARRRDAGRGRRAPGSGRAPTRRSAPAGLPCGRPRGGCAARRPPV